MVCVHFSIKVEKLKKISSYVHKNNIKTNFESRVYCQSADSMHKNIFTLPPYYSTVKGSGATPQYNFSAQLT